LEFDKARATFESGHNIFVNMPLTPGKSATICCGFLNHMAWNELRRWDFPSAQRYIDRAEAMIANIPAESAGRARAQLHTYRALLSAGQGEYRTAVAQLEEAAEICRMELPHALRSAENNLALALVQVGDINRARQIATRILDIETEENLDSGRPGILICLGTIAEAMGEWENATKIYEESLLLADQFDNFSAATSALAGLMRTYERIGDTGKSDGTWTRAVTMQQRTLPEAQMGGLFLARATALAHRQDWEGVQQICTEWGPRLDYRHCQMEAAALETLAIRAELERLKASGAGDRMIWPRHDRSKLARRIVLLEGYLRREGLRNCLVDYGQLQLHLALAGFEGISVDGVLAELLDHLRSMGATARLAGIAEEFVGTPISERPTFKLAFAPACGTRTTPAPKRRLSLTHEVASEIPDGRHHVHTFGRLKVLPAGCSQFLTRAQWGSRRARVLLAYLLAKDLDGRGLTREQICDAVWPDTDAFDPSNAFHISLSRLRAAFRQGQSDSSNSPISFHDGLYHLANDVWCDAREFELATTRADTLSRAGRKDEALAARKAAFELYEGEFLADTDEIWAEPRRERYRIRFLETGNALVKAAIQERSHEEAERIAERIREIDPQGAKELRLLSLLRDRFPQS
jgi:DNA-binding SARP family transcriptional activator